METKRVTMDFAERASIATTGEATKVVMNEIETNTDIIPWKETFKSDSLNGTVVKPMVELITERDMIKGEVLSRSQH